MLPTVLALIGLGLQAVGIVVAGRGYLTTWRAFAAPDEGLLDHWRAGLARAQRYVARLLRRRQDVSVEPPAASLTLTGGRVSAYDTVVFPELRKRITAREAIPELDRRTRVLADKLARLEPPLLKDIVQLSDDVEALRRDVNRMRQALEQRDQLVATSGIRAQADGLILIGAGLALQGMALFIDLLVAPPAG